MWIITRCAAISQRGLLLGLIQHPETLSALRDDADERLSERDLHAEAATLQEHREGLLRRREFVTEQGADAAEAGVLDRKTYAKKLAAVDADLAEVDEDLAAIKAEREGVESERRSVESLVLDITEAPDEGVETFTTKGRSPGKAPKRLSQGWLFLLIEEVRAALTRNNRGATPPPSPWAVEETKHLAERLGLVVVLTRNDEGKYAAHWPTVSVGLNLDSLRRLDSVLDVRHGDGSAAQSTTR